MAENFKVYNRFVSPCIQLEHSSDGGRVYLKDITNFQIKHQNSTEFYSADPKNFFFDYDSIYKNFWFKLPMSWDESKSLGGKIKFNYKGSPAVVNGSPEISVDLAWNPRPSFNTVKSPSTIQITKSGVVEIQLTSDGNPLDRLNTGLVFYPQYIRFEADQDEKTIKLKSSICDEDAWIWGYHHRGKYNVTIPESLIPGNYKLYVCVCKVNGEFSPLRVELPVNDTRPKLKPASYYLSLYNMEVSSPTSGQDITINFLNFTHSMIANADKSTNNKYIAVVGGGIYANKNDFGWASNGTYSVQIITSCITKQTSQNITISYNQLKALLLKMSPGNIERKTFINGLKFFIAVAIDGTTKNIFLEKPLPSHLVSELLNPSSGGGSGSGAGTGGDSGDGSGTGTGTETGGKPPSANNPTTEYVPPDDSEIGVNIGGGSSSGQRAIVLKQKGANKIIVDFINFKWDDIDDMSL